MLNTGRPQLRALIQKHEGLRLKPYTDTVGKLTIGVGRNLSDIGISELEANLMLTNDLARATTDAATFPWFNSISVTRQDVVISMVFNLGIEAFKEFKKLIQAISLQNYEAAASEMLSSKWASQVGPRATELAKMMRSGSYVGV